MKFRVKLNEQEMQAIHDLLAKWQLDEDGYGTTPTGQGNLVAGMEDMESVDINQDYPEPELEDDTDLKDIVYDSLEKYFESDEFMKKHGEKADEVAKKTEKFLNKRIAKFEESENADEEEDDDLGQ